MAIHISKCFACRPQVGRLYVPAALGLWFLATLEMTHAAEKPHVTIVEFEGQVHVARARATVWTAARTNQALFVGDRLRTLDKSRAVVRLSDLSLLRLGQFTHVRFIQRRARRSGFDLLRGLLYYFHRDKRGEFPVRTPTAYAVVLGTEFTITVAADNSTRLDLIDGQVEMTNELGGITLVSGEAGQAMIGQKPEKVPAIDAVNVIQWVLYYPGVLNLEDLDLTGAEQALLAESLAAYREGDLPAALASYPAGRVPGSDFERIYLAALRLSVGSVEEAQSGLAAIQSPNPRVAALREALRTLIAGVKLQALPLSPALSPEGGEGGRLATGWLAESYYQQSRWNLDAALGAARKAVERSPQFAFGWARVAELEFSFGRNRQAEKAVDRSLQLAPRNAQAVALKGFLLAGANRPGRAITAFNQAIALNGALGNAWLGRGLCRIRGGDVSGGLEDLQMACVLEPQRAVLRSYLGKAFGQVADDPRAMKELDLARQLDPKDPTAWLYSALLNQQHNRINQAVRDLEHSQGLNDNRRVYRSSLLVDQDRAARGANLAAIYLDAGMTDLSRREAVRAVNVDYANYSAHLFLADSYHALRDPRQINLRYETPWLSEYLVGNLLAPVGAGAVSQTVSQQEYGRLFERNRLGVVSATEYLSRGDWTQSGAQYGRFDRTEYAAEAFYQSRHGQRANNDLEQLTLAFQLKQQITPRDTAYFQAIYYDAEAGHVAPVYDPKDTTEVNLGLRTQEQQEPLLLAGYHHQWAPGSHTLFLGGRLVDDLAVANPRQRLLVLGKDAAGLVTDAAPITIEQQYRSEVEMYSVEAQQIWQRSGHSVVGGARFQMGEFDTRNQHTNAIVPVFPALAGLFPNPPEHIAPEFQRASGYGYYHWQVAAPLLLVAGLSYDWLKQPENFRYAPLGSGETTRDQWSPKGGFILAPTRSTTIRAGYAQGLGGVSFDRSFQLEPTQIAGFNQAFRSVIPEAVAGANSGERYEVWGVSLEQRIGRGTYLALGGNWLESEIDRTFGVYDFFQSGFVVEPSGTREQLDYRERGLTLTVNQLVGEQWSFGLEYRVAQAELKNNFVNVPDTALLAPPFRPRGTFKSVLHQVRLLGLYQHHSGIFGGAEAWWNSQANKGYTSPPRPGDDFWQFNAWIGYRLPRRHAEFQVGVLNLTDQDYRLNPLNLTPELPRGRTVALRCRFYF